MCTNLARLRFQQGVSLVEIIVFIVIVSVSIAGVLSVLDKTTRNSTHPLIRKQALAIAESLMQEIQQMPFTYCDPDDANAATATSAASCTLSQDASITGPTPGNESRYSAANPFDNVADYGGFTMPSAECAGICIIGNPTPIANLNGYAERVVLSRVGGVAPFTSMASDAVLKIEITVTGPANTTLKLTGYRVRYAPNV